MSKRIAIIGAGWAGCSAAVKAISAGFDVTLFEASHVAGGRARRTWLDGMALDNGQHILLGACHKTLDMMQQIGIDTGEVFLHLPLQMRYPPFPLLMDFAVPHLPSPLHLVVGLLKAKGLSGEDKLALARFFTRCRAIAWDIGEDRPVIRLLEQFRQTRKVYALLWRPLCLAVMNTPPEMASARVFLAVLRDSLGKRQRDANMLLPRCDLSALFPEKALKFCIKHGASIHFGKTVRHIAYDEKGWMVDCAKAERFDALILATSAEIASSLVSPLSDVPPFVVPESESITTCYLKYPASVRLEHPFYALLDYPEKDEWGQFVFDRGHFMKGQDGLLAVVISASSAVSHDKDRLLSGIIRQLVNGFGNAVFEKPVWSRIITEKRATFTCTPDLVRPDSLLDKRGLLLAGDYVAGEYPATLEAALSSGIKAIRILSDI